MNYENIWLCKIRIYSLILFKGLSISITIWYKLDSFSYRSVCSSYEQVKQ